MSTFMRGLMLLIAMLSFGACEKEDLGIAPSGSNDIIVASKFHLAFPDLRRVNGAWYLAYRFSDSHVYGEFSKIYVLKSYDFIHWHIINVYEHDHYDLRDPKFSYDDLKQKFYLHIHGVNTVGEYGSVRLNYIINYLDSIGKFDQQLLTKNLPLLDRYAKDWLWRPEWFNGKLYVGGYFNGSFRIYKYETIDEEPLVIKTIDWMGLSESTIRFHDDEVFILIRGATESFFGTAPKETIDNFKRESSGIDLKINKLANYALGGPNMILINKRAYIVGRLKDGRTGFLIYNLTENAMEQIHYLESFGDNSYPGMVLHNNKIYGVYYTQSKDLSEFQLRRFIYDVNQDLDE